MTPKPSEIKKYNCEIKTRPAADTLTFKNVWDRRGIYIKRMKIGGNIFYFWGSYKRRKCSFLPMQKIKKVAENKVNMDI